MNRGLKIILPIGLFLLIAVGVLSSWSIQQLIQTTRFEKHSLAVQAKIDDVFGLVQGAETSQRGFLLTGRQEYLRTYLAAVPEIPRELARLRKLLKDVPSQAERLDRLESLIRNKLEDLRLTIALTEDSQGAEALAIVRTDQGENLTNQIREICDRLDKAASDDLRHHEEFLQKYSSLIGTIVGVGSALAILLVCVFAYLSFAEIKRRAETEKDLKGAQEAALIASRLKSQFLATVSHEIRTPLNGIIGMSDVLRTRVKESENRRFVDVIHNSGEALLKIVNDILDFSKIEAGRIEFEIIEFSLAGIVEMSAELLSVKAREKSLALMTYVDPEIPDRLLGDSSRTAQVLRNLISNAVKFTNSGEVYVTAALRFRSGQKAVVRFEVRDTGSGIDPSQQPLLFQPFNQLVTGSEARSEGTGLGLSICKSLTEHMGGRIGVDSEFGQGSTFWFEIPFSVSERASAPREISLDGTFINVAAAPFLRETLARFAQECRVPAVFLSADTDLDLNLRAALSTPGRKTFFLSVDDMSADRAKDIAEKITSDTQTTVIATTRSQFDDLEGSLISKNPSVRFLRLPFSRDQFFEALTGGESSPTLTADRDQEEAATPGEGLILVVEDNSTNQILAQMQLEQLGYRVHSVANGEEALEALTRIQYDLVLMDCQMPVMNGFEATRRIRLREATTGHRTPIVAMTANATKGDRERCLSVGMDDYISKPTKINELSRVIIHQLTGEAARAVDWTVLKELEGKTNSTVVTRLIQSFLKTLPQSLDHIQQLRTSGDRASLRYWAHQLKSSSASLGALELSKLCDDLERSTETEEPADVLAEKAGVLLEHGQIVLQKFKEQTNYVS